MLSSNWAQLREKKGGGRRKGGLSAWGRPKRPQAKRPAAAAPPVRPHAPKKAKAEAAPRAAAAAAAAADDGASDLSESSDSEGDEEAAARLAREEARRKKEKKKEKKRHKEEPKAEAAPAKVSLMQVAQAALTPFVAIDCEMVGAGPGGKRSILARCSLVNFAGEVLYDRYVRPTETVTDYRTEVSGIRPRDITGGAAIPFAQCQREAAALLEGRVLVGHSLAYDLDALQLTHPRALIRDTAQCKLLCPDRPRSLKVLVREQLGETIQTGEHSSVVDARSVLRVYKSVRAEWEKSMRSNSRTARMLKSARILEAGSGVADGGAAATARKHHKKHKRRRGDSSSREPQPLPSDRPVDIFSKKRRRQK